LAGGMPIWKYAANRFLTRRKICFLGYKLAEYHTGYRAFSRRLLETPAAGGRTATTSSSTTRCGASDLGFGFHSGRSLPAPYFPEASSINFAAQREVRARSAGTALEYRAARWGCCGPTLRDTGRKLPSPPAALPPEAGVNPPGSAGGVLRGGRTRTTSLPTASFCSMVAWPPGSAPAVDLMDRHRESSSGDRVEVALKHGLRQIARSAAVAGETHAAGM